MLLPFLLCYCGCTISTPSQATSSFMDQILSLLMWLFSFLPKLLFSSVLDDSHQNTNISLCSLFLDNTSLPNYHCQFSAVPYHPIHQTNCLHSLCPLLLLLKANKLLVHHSFKVVALAMVKTDLAIANSNGSNRNFWSTGPMLDGLMRTVCRISLLPFPILSRRY